MDDGSEQLFVGLILRVAFADEPLRLNGVNHLLEHLALPTVPIVGADCNGSVDCLMTSLSARGDAVAACEIISQASARLASPPEGQIERERNILRAEEDMRGWNQWAEALSLRYGPMRHGLVAYRELAPSFATDRAIVDWARTRFTRTNAAVYFSGRPPKGMRLHLRMGQRRRVPAPDPIPHVRYPAVYSSSTPGAVAIAMVCHRSYATSAALRIGVARLRQQLRHQMGMSYDVSWRSEPLNKRQSHVLVWANCLPTNVLATRNRMLGVLEDLALAGPTEAEVENGPRGSAARRNGSGLRSRVPLVYGDASPAREPCRDA